MIPKIIHRVWLGGRPVPAPFLEWETRLRELHPDWTFRLWTDADVPQLNVRQLVARTCAFCSKANMVRLEVVYREGGIYLDHDIEPIRTLDPLLNHQAFSCLETDNHLNNAAFGADAGHPWIAWQLKKLVSYASLAPPWGPQLMNAAPRDGVTILPSEAFYPKHWHQQFGWCQPGTYAVHHWARSWQSLDGFDLK